MSIHSEPKVTPWEENVGPLLRRHTGPLTRELLLSPGKFGLGLIPDRATPDGVTDMICGFCSTGCSLRVHLLGDQPVRVSPSTHYPVNLGMACPKGWEALSVLAAPDRATVPLLRNTAGQLRPTDWDTALKTFVSRFKAILAEHGPESVAFLGTGQMPSEELALLGSVAKFGMGLVHGDGNTRQCMATAVVAYKQAFGFDAPPYTYQDFEDSDTLVFIGANPCIAHPILWERVMRNKQQPEIIVVDPRRTETAMQATQHLQVRPKADLDLLYGIAHILLREGWVNRDYINAHTTGFDDFATFVQPYTPQRTAETTGLSIEQIERFARSVGTRQRVSLWWTMGVNQSHQGVRTAQAIINLALMTGNIGRPGTGANSITGQCNAMGSRLFANTTSLLGGHDFASAADREKVARILGIDPARIPQKPSLSYPEIMERILAGKIRGLWVFGTNPSHSWISQNQCDEIFDRLDFLVVQDMYHTTETATRAHLMLPAAGWGEKDGTFINSERRIGLLKKVARAPGQALADFWIGHLIAHYWGCSELFTRWKTPAAVFKLLQEVTRNRPCDITGIGGYEHLNCGGVQWPYPSENADDAPQRRLFEDGKFYHPDGRAKFICEASRPLPEPVSRDYPFNLLTGRGSAAQWHTQTRTGKSAVLRKLAPEELYLEIHPDDAQRLGIRPRDWLEVRSQRGMAKARAFVTPAVPVGQVFLPMHYATANHLTHASFDPYSKQPAYKACAVSVRRWGEPPSG